MGKVRFIVEACIQFVQVLFVHSIVQIERSLLDMIARTKELIEAGEKIIAEASFSYDGLFCSVDILKNLGRKCVEIYEVKSSTSVHDYHYDDVAFQTYVLTQLGYEVKQVSLVHIDSSYVRHGALELDKLFAFDDLTSEALDMIVDVRKRAEFLERYLSAQEEPAEKIGTCCFSPFSCGFWNYCTRDLPHPNVFDLHSVQTQTKFKLFAQGIISFADLEKAKLNPGAKLQVKHELNDTEDEIDVPAIRTFLGTLSYPLYFLDFESFQPAVPLYDNTRPYTQITFQYSLHYVEHEGGELIHKEFLAYPGVDPRKELAKQLCKDIPDNVCVLAYNMAFEKTRIKEMADLCPKLSGHLMRIYDNIRDLMVPFEKKAYYNRRMQGSYSIKYVLPALYPDDPTLDYHNLEGVHNGTEASDTFRRMQNMQPQELEQWREHLLKYCGLDTYAMVKVWEKLVNIVGTGI